MKDYEFARICFKSELKNYICSLKYWAKNDMVIGETYEYMKDDYNKLLGYLKACYMLDIITLYEIRKYSTIALKLLEKYRKL